MAKRSIMGVISGKLGNMVGQKNSLVSNKDKQVWRVYQGTVANPKTVKQAHQRSLFVAAKNFQRAFEDILNHSWQGVEYGTKSLNHFRSMVLAGGGSGFPFFYQPKGAQKFIPQAWPISRGSLNMHITCSIGDDNLHVKVQGINKVTGDAPATKGELWQAFLAANPSFKDGDMITFVTMVTAHTGSRVEDEIFIPLYDRFIINTSDNTANDGFILKSQTRIFSLVVDPSESNVIIQNGDDLYEYYSFGVIVSRQNGNKASWLRSKSNMSVEAYAISKFNSTEYITKCLDSFMNSTNAAESDWYLNQTGENDDEEQGGGGDTPSQTISIESKEAALTPSGSVFAAYITKGSLRGYIMYNGQYFVIRGNDVVAQSFDEGKSFSPSLTTIDLNEGLMEEIEAAGYHFLFPIEPDEP